MVPTPVKPTSWDRDSYINRKGFPGVCGFIDGTDIPVKPPSWDRDSYINRKDFPGVP